MISRILCRLGWHKPYDFREYKESCEYTSFDGTKMLKLWKVRAATCWRCGSELEVLDNGRCRKRVSI